MQSEAVASSTRRRKVPRAERRQQLIDATISCIAKRGFSGTTLADVARTAGLSQGIVNLHFNTKDTLLHETLQHLRDEYRQIWTKAIEDAGPDPVAQLSALIDVDFSPAVCDRDKLAVWFAFQGEAKSRPTYRKTCEEHDDDYDEALERIVKQVIKQGGYRGIKARDVAYGFSAMAEGMWLSILVTPNQMSAADGRRICRSYFAQYFPNHFKRK